MAGGRSFARTDTLVHNGWGDPPVFCKGNAEAGDLIIAPPLEIRCDIFVGWYGSLVLYGSVALCLLGHCQCVNSAMHNACGSETSRGVDSERLGASSHTSVTHHTALYELR